MGIGVVLSSADVPATSSPLLVDVLSLGMDGSGADDRPIGPRCAKLLGTALNADGLGDVSNCFCCTVFVLAGGLLAVVLVVVLALLVLLPAVVIVHPITLDNSRACDGFFMSDDEGGIWGTGWVAGVEANE